MSTSKKLINSILFVILLTFVSKVFGFIRDAVVAAYLGVSGTADAYYLGTLIPTVLFDIGLACLSNSFLPLFIDVKLNEGDENAHHFASKVLNVYALITLSFTLIGITLAPLIVRLFAPGMDIEYRNIAIVLTRIAFPVVFFKSIIFILISIHQADKRFGTSVLEGIFLSFTTILACLFTYKSYKIYALTVAFVFAYVLYDILLILQLRKKFKYRISTNFKDKYLRKMLAISVPIILGTAVKDVNMVVDRIMASSLDEGTIAAIYYTDRINAIVIGIFVYAICMVMYPEFSEAAAKNDLQEVGRKLKTAISAIMLLCIPATAYIIIMGQDIVRLLYERGGFDKNATQVTAYALNFFILVLLPQGIRDILGRTFYALKDTKTPMINGIIAMTANIIFNIILVRYIGLAGLGLSTAVSVYIAVCLMFIGIAPVVGNDTIREILNNGAKIVLITIPTGLAIWWASRILMHMYSIIRLVATFSIAISVFFAGVYLLNILDARKTASNIYKLAYARFRGK